MLPDESRERAGRPQALSWVPTMALNRRATTLRRGLVLVGLTSIWALPALAQRRVEVTLTAAPARMSLVPGATTELFAYNGQFPGPTLEFREGDRVTVHFKNELPEPTTIHWHGLHLPIMADGSPFNPVAPGGATTTSSRSVPEPRGRTGIIRIPTIARAIRSRKGCTAPSSCAPPTIRCADSPRS